MRRIKADHHLKAGLYFIRVSFILLMLFSNKGFSEGNAEGYAEADEHSELGLELNHEQNQDFNELALSPEVIELVPELSEAEKKAEKQRLKQIQTEKEAESFYRQGESFLQSSAGIRSYPNAIKLYRKAAALGHIQAQEKLKRLSFYLPTEPSLQKRYRRELKAAKEGKAESQFLVAEMCEFGLGLEQDDKRALYWYKQSANKNYGKAQNRLGELYAEGSLKEEAAVNKEQAFAWIQSAANNNQAQAQYKLAAYYYSGEQVEKNLEEAFHWYLQSAQNGNVLGQMQTAQMLKLGEGCMQNYEQALFWYEKALAQEYEPAREQVQEVNTILDDIFIKNFK